jgi:hypothetical protein
MGLEGGYMPGQWDDFSIPVLGDFLGMKVVEVAFEDLSQRLVISMLITWDQQVSAHGNIRRELQSGAFHWQRVAIHVRQAVF